jgi:hypothetical protein
MVTPVPAAMNERTVSDNLNDNSAGGGERAKTVEAVERVPATVS